MFITNIFGKEEITAKAASLGLKAGESVGKGYGKPAIGGNTFAFKDSLKASGARWIGEDKVWGFDSWESLTSAVESISK